MANIMLKNYAGIDVTYRNIESISVLTEDGEIQVYRAKAIPEGTVLLTFCSYDGTVLYERYIFIGDSCPDPVDQGKVEVSETREDTETALYGKYLGWGLSADGPVDKSVFSNITEPLTLYTVYAVLGEVIIPEQTLTFTHDAFTDSYKTTYAATTKFVAGTQYSILWDGVEYVCTCVDEVKGSFVLGGSTSGVTMSLVVGDHTIQKAVFGSTITWNTSGPDVPFCIVGSSTNLSVVADDKKPTHRVKLVKINN